MTLARRRIAFLSHRDDVETLPALERAAYSWLSTQFDYQVDLLPFARAEQLKEYDAAWWYYTETAELPTAALDAVDEIKSYVDGGGKLFLSLIAARYVKPMGIDRGPDAVEFKDERMFYGNGYVALEKHPIFEGLPKQFFVAPGATVKPFRSARWLEAPPENGKILGIATWGARFVEGERVVVEWESGSGQVLAVGMHNFRFDASEVNQNLTRFARNIFRYLSAPLIVNLSLESDSPATQQGAGYLGEHYGAGGVVAEAGQGITAVISGKAWKKLDLIATGRTPSATKTEHVSFTPGQNFSVKLHLDAKGLQPGEYTAGVELAQGEDIIASAERKFFLIPKSEETGPVDKHWIWEVRSEKISAEIDKGTGVVWGLHDPSDPKPVQFAANPDNLPALATAEHRWLGDLGLKFRFEGDTSWRSMSTAQSAPVRQVLSKDDAVVVSYDPGAPEQSGPANPAISEKFSIENGELNWKIRVRNRCDRSLVLGELAIPIAMNTFFAGEVDVEEIYARRVIMHSFAGGSSSWILAAPLGGRPPYLLLWCKEGTKLEAIAHVNDYGPKPDGWEGLINVFPISQASRDTRNWKEWFNGHSIVPIRPGGEYVADFGMKFIQDYSEIGDTLFESGKVDVDIAPGMVLPTDMTGHIKVRSKRKLTVTGEDAEIELVRTQGLASIYKFRFTKPGEHNLTITDDAGEVTNLHFMAIEPIEKLASAHAAHIARDQQVKTPGRRNGMFYMWDSEENRPVDDPRHEFMCGGSDEIGFADSLPLVWKNVLDPNPEEIAAMEYYVENFLMKTLQKPETYEVAASITDNPNEELDYTRSFNYPHVVNIYFALSKISERYGLTRFRTADEYLMMAHRTAMVYYTGNMYKDNARTIGNFGESYFVELVAALREKGHASEADELEKHIQSKADYFLAKAYPYESEFPFDTTGYAEAYYLKKYAGGPEGAAPAVDMIRATRGRQFSWWWYGGDVRWGWGCSKYPYPDELCLNYMTSQNGRALLDNFNQTGEIEDLRLGYGSYLAYWSLIREDGIARNLYTWEPQRMVFDPWSSETGTGLYFLYNVACSYAVDDPDFGLIGYGCDVEGETTGHISIIPRDGMSKRATIVPLGLALETTVGRIDRVDAEDGGKKLAVLLRETTQQPLKAILTAKGLPAGEYTLSANYVEIGTFSSDQCAAGLELSLPAGASVPVHIQAK